MTEQLSREDIVRAGQIVDLYWERFRKWHAVMTKASGAFSEPSAFDFRWITIDANGDAEFEGEYYPWGYSDGSQECGAHLESRWVLYSDEEFEEQLLVAAEELKVAIKRQKEEAERAEKERKIREKEEREQSRIAAEKRDLKRLAKKYPEVLK